MVVNISTLVMAAYAHFENQHYNLAQRDSYWSDYAIYEMHLEGHALETFHQVTEDACLRQLNPLLYERFYVWYYINYVIDLPKDSHYDWPKEGPA
jgi:hypothetical protein